MTDGDTIRLPDGRRLGYSTYGEPQGRPFFFCHGFPGSRLQARLGHETAARLGVRIVSLDRPGMGLSDYRPERTILDWPDDVCAAADALGIDRFALGGLSGGGPYALACAFKVPERLIGVALVSGMAPLSVPANNRGMTRLARFTFALSGRLPWTARPSMWWLRREVVRNPAAFMARMSRNAPTADQALMARPDVKATLVDDLQEAFRQGSMGAARELVLYSRPWGFPLKDIRIPVHLWQGEADVNVPPAMGRYLASVIPTCHARFLPGEGHLLAVDHMEEVQAAVFAR